VGFLPDVLAHGGVAYNDLPLAVGFLASIWAMDVALRRPGLFRGVLAGVLVSLTVATKHTGLVLGPIAVLLLLAELITQPADQRRRWLHRVAPTLLAALVVGYLVQVLLYQGDFTLAFLRRAIGGAQQHIQGGHGVPAYLLGRTMEDAPWYFYPVAFLFKTSIALHVLMLFAAWGGILALRRASWQTFLAGRPRALLLAGAVFLFFLLRANLVIGFRYALPLLPLLCILTAAGLMVVWRGATRVIRAVLLLLVVWSAVSTLSYYPHFLAYTSEYQGDPDLGHYVFVDSSLDWGQALPELAAFMREEGIPRVYLSYFGTAFPEAYGVRYVPLPSFAMLPAQPEPEQPPQYAVISATNLIGLYFIGDPFRELRRREPYRVLGHTLFVYRVNP
jgi:hypothetical protein